MKGVDRKTKEVNMALKGMKFVNARHFVTVNVSRPFGVINTRILSCLQF